MPAVWRGVSTGLLGWRWAVWTLLGTFLAAAPAAAQQSLSREYVRLGGRVVAIENPASSGAPPAPAGLAATAGNHQIVLNWNASSGATSYNVYRGTATGAEGTTPIASGITSTSFTDTGLTNNATYYYKVAAVNASGTSGKSNEAWATPVCTPTTLTYQNTTLTAGVYQACVSITISPTVTINPTVTLQIIQ
jgi:hypothetical protein